MDAVTKLEALTARLGELQAETERVHAERNAALLELRAEGWSYDRLAVVAKVSKARIQQLVRSLERSE